MLSIYQGSTLNLTITIEGADEQPYLLQTGDKMRFGVKYIENGGSYLIYKELTSSDEVDGEYPLELTPEDTDISPRRYYYDVSLQLADGSLYYIVPADYFIVKKSVTHKGDSAS